MLANRNYKDFSCLPINGNRGFTYIGLLLFIAIVGIGSSVVGITWQYQVRTEKEKQLLFVGSEFSRAINSYYVSSQGAKKVYPESLEDLLLDKRTPNIKRHLRKIYRDPMTGQKDWGYVIKQGRIVGVYSQSTLAPFKKKGFNLGDAKFAQALSYREWVFSDQSINNQQKLNEVIEATEPSNKFVYISAPTSKADVSQRSSSTNNGTSDPKPSQGGVPGDRLRYDPNFQP